ncbi:MAG: right-handed parallel beta-helix repeat-containing protein, partial [Candidatus Bathyarchaeota archaeon]|nr:right-handed parallel beta-helix repeat-containing protein [Candidatus Bathyarchaeota archaeon]
IGIYLSGRSNVTIKNMEVRAFESGIQLNDSSNNTISANNVTNNEYGIVLFHYSSQNTLRSNFVSDNRYNLGIFTASASGYIQDIDDSNTVNGKPVYYWVNKRDMVVPLDAGYVVLANCTHITVKNLNLANNMQGIALAFTTRSILTNNSLINNFDGIRLDHSSNNNLISGNNITTNTHYGIRFFYDPSANMKSKINAGYGGQLDGPSCDNVIYGNNLTDNGSGIRLDYPSNNTISANNVANNSEEGIGLYRSSSTNTVARNTIVNNSYGLWLYNSYNNLIYNNNFIGNMPQVYPSLYNNLWDAGYPSGGNYWSPQYHGTDIYSGLYQNESGCDGIGDTPYSLDNYPLMGMFHDFDIASEHQVQTICNSTISGFKFNGTAISFNVTGENSTTGFCRVCIPTALLEDTYRVFVNDIEILPSPEPLPFSNITHNHLYFSYNHSTQEVIVIPEFRSQMILPIFMIGALLAAITYRRKALG